MPIPGKRKIKDIVGRGELRIRLLQEVVRYCYAGRAMPVQSAPLSGVLRTVRTGLRVQLSGENSN